MNLQNINVVQGQVSCIKHYQHGRFELHIDQNVFFGRSMNQPIIAVNDKVRIVFNVQDQEVYAALNLSKKILFLHPNLQRIKKFSVKHYFRLTFPIFLSITLVVAVVYALYQYALDGTIYYIDLLHGTLIIMALTLVIILAGLGFYSTDGQYNNSKKLYKLLEIPPLYQDALYGLEFRNSYFRVEPNHFDLTALIKLQQQMTSSEIVDYLNKKTKHKNKFGLNVFEIERLGLIEIESNISDIRQTLKRKNSFYTDAFIEVTAKLNNQRVYGYFDEFLFKPNQKLYAIISEYADQKGHYIWLISDLEKYLVVDEEITVEYENLLNSYLSIYKEIFDKETLTQDGVVGIIIGAIFIALILFDLLGVVMIVIILFVFMILGFMLYAIFNYFSSQRQIDLYIKSVIQKKVIQFDLNRLGNFKSTYIYNERRGKNSRTGFRID